MWACGYQNVNVEGGGVYQQAEDRGEGTVPFDWIRAKMVIVDTRDWRKVVQDLSISGFLPPTTKIPSCHSPWSHVGKKG